MVEVRAIGEETDSPIKRALLEVASSAIENDKISQSIKGVEASEEYVVINVHEPFSSTSWASELKPGSEEGAVSETLPAGTLPQNGDGESDEAVGLRTGLGVNLVNEMRRRLAPPPSFFAGPFARELESILDAVGGTPLVKLSRLAQVTGCSCQLLAKCEFLNAGGSSKDRIAKAMVISAEQRGLLAPGSILVEPTSGNTGIGLAMTAAVKGYKAVIAMPRKMSNEKQSVLRALGASIVRTPSNVAWNDQRSHVAASIRLLKVLDDNSRLRRLSAAGAFLPDQYRNAFNPLAHFWGTAEELLAQSEGRLDMVVVGAGTGGTVTGVGRLVKARISECLVVGVDPEGSALSALVLRDPKNKRPSFTKAHSGVFGYQVEGIGYDFVPSVLDGGVVDFWEKVSDKEAFACARLLVQREGMLVGGSSGAALAGALKAIDRLKWTRRPDKRVAIILPDSSRNYLSKFISDEWMADHDFLNPSALPRQYEQLRGRRVSSIEARPVVFVSETDTLAFAARALSEAPASAACALVVVARGALLKEAPLAKECAAEAVLGVACASDVLKALGEGGDPRSLAERGVCAAMDSDFVCCAQEESLSRAAQRLELRPLVLVKNQRGAICGALERRDLIKSCVLQEGPAKQST